jgi:hypothetical protein
MDALLWPPNDDGHRKAVISVASCAPVIAARRHYRASAGNRRPISVVPRVVAGPLKQEFLFEVVVVGTDERVSSSPHSLPFSFR